MAFGDGPDEVCENCKPRVNDCVSCVNLLKITFCLSDFFV